MNEKQFNTMMQMFAHMSEQFVVLGDRIDAMEKRLDARIDALEARLDARIDALEARLDALEAKLDASVTMLNRRIDALDERIDALDTSMHSYLKDMAELHHEHHLTLYSHEKRITRLEKPRKAF